MVDMVRRLFIPAVIKYQTVLAKAINEMEHTGKKLIHKWARKWQTGGDAGLDPRMRRSINNTETKLERLRRENYRLRMERDVLRALKALREGKLDGSWD